MFVEILDLCVLLGCSIARHLQKHHRLLSVLETMDNGKSFRETRDADVNIIIRHFYHHAGWAQLMNTEMRGWKSVGEVSARCHQCYILLQVLAPLALWDTVRP